MLFRLLNICLRKIYWADLSKLVIKVASINFETNSRRTWRDIL
jgi:hypothetical protein